MNAVKEYQDFEIEIHRGEEGYRANVLDSPAGTGSAPFVPPVDQIGLTGLRASVQQVIRGAARDLGSSGGAQGNSADQAQEIGPALYKALFWGKVKELFDQSIEPLGAADRGLRVKLRFDLRTSDSWLGDLPWELLRHPEQPAPLAMSPRTPLVRFLVGGITWPSLPFEPPLQVLAAAANPVGSQRLDLEAECIRLEAAAGDSSKVRVTFLRHATLDALGQSIRAGRFHVLHFMGHGESAAQGSALHFERSGGFAESVSGLALAGNFQDDPRLRLVVLNACHGGEVSGGADPFFGVATTLVQAGLPAAVAMQAAISDRGAVAFTTSLYESLASGDPIDAAVTQARRAISPNWQASLEWSVPVLFLRVPDGRLFRTVEAPPPPAPTLLPPEQRPAELPGSVHTKVEGGVHAHQVVFGPQFNNR